MNTGPHWWITWLFICLFLQVIPTVKGPLPLPTSIASGSSMSSPFLMPSHISPFLHSSTQPCTVTLPPLYHKSGSSAYFGMDTFDPNPQQLDSLDSLNITDFKTGTVLYLSCCRGFSLILHTLLLQKNHLANIYVPENCGYYGIVSANAAYPPRQCKNC